MSSLRQKLHSPAGVSMLIALLFFLVCLTVGSLILTAATANASKTRGRYAREQDYLALASAARLLQEVFGQHTYTAGRDLHTEASIDPVTGEPVIISHWEDIVPFITPAGPDNGDMLTDAFASPLPETSPFEITAGEGMPQVEAVLHMEAGGNAVITLTRGSQVLQVTFTCRTAQVSGHGYEREITSWSRGVITRGRRESP